MDRDYIRNYITYCLPGNLTDDEWRVILNNIESLLLESYDEGYAKASIKKEGEVVRLLREQKQKIKTKLLESGSGGNWRRVINQL